jgi:hypothetical protein
MEKLIILNAWELIVYNEMCQQFPNISSVTIEDHVDRASQIMLDKPVLEFNCGMLKTIVKRDLLDLVRSQNRIASRYGVDSGTQHREKIEATIYQDEILQKRLLLEINHLDETTRYILEQRAIGYKPYAAISQEIGITTSAARKRFSVTRGHLKKALLPLFKQLL